MMVIHDCDNGLGLFAADVDDGLAMLYLLGCPGIDLLGVTTCFGNASLRRVDRATRNLLAYLGNAAVPVFSGAARPGTAATPAARFLVECVNRFPGRVTIVATGPLTNLAAAAALEPDFFSRVQRVVCLGGNLFPTRVGWRPINEVNFAADPEAAAGVLRAGRRVELFPATSCLAVTFGWPDLARLAGMGAAFRRVVARWLHCARIGRGVDHFILWDILPVVWLTRPELFIAETASVELGPRGRLDRGSGERHTVITGVRDSETVRETWFAVLRDFAARQRS